MPRLILRSAIALLALVSLSGCAVERLTGPNVDLSPSARDGAAVYSEHQTRPRDDDPKPPPGSGDPGDGIGTASDTLRAGGEER